jgi:hypothetical protein
MYGMAEAATRPEFFAGLYEVRLSVVSNFLSPTTQIVGPTSVHFFFYNTRRDE